MGVVSLVLEVRELVEEMGKEGDVVVMVVGGIVCGKGVVVGLVLGEFVGESY